ncbi:MAG TPA: PKD domain-containing protein [Beutenbergiaceae bacterium]|nr:PKD domain-containing protein [Beutenbergiaceae bacterium]
MDEVSCYDPESGERFYAWPPAADGDEGPAEDDEESPVVVTGAQLATAVREFVRVQIAPAPLIIQPEQDWHLVNLPVIVRTEPNAQEFSAELLGLPVDIRAEPVSYSWDFGDGSAVLNTTEAGAPYPDETITHSYTEVGEYQITMVAYWSGSFRVGGGPWIEIDGLGVTSSTSPLLDLQARTTRLVG